jgi:putative CocE/NonD family hydrolase
MKTSIRSEMVRCGLFLLISVVLAWADHHVRASDGSHDDQQTPEPGAAATPLYDIVILGGRVVDGTGNAWFHGDIAIRGDRIARVAPAGMLQFAAAKERIDADGLVVCPGFIDIQGQSREALLSGDGRVISKVTQGVTTEIMGEGWTDAPVSERALAVTNLVDPEAANRAREFAVPHGFDAWLRAMERHGSSVNFGSFVGSATIRACAKGMDQGPPTASELNLMRRFVREAMEDGAFGIASALIYPPDNFVSTADLTALAKVMAPYGGVYISHIRSEADRLLEAIDEAIAIGRDGGVPVEIYHLKAAGRRNWPKAEAVIARIAAARAQGLDVGADMYPYVAGSTGLTAVLPPTASAGGKLLERLADPAERARIRAEVLEPKTDWENMGQLATPEGILVLGLKKPENVKYAGKRLSEIAQTMHKPWLDAAIDLILSERQSIATVYFMMNEENLKLQLRQPWIKFGTDAAGVDPGHPQTLTHPRSYGTFPRILGKYVREERAISLEDAIRKMTSAVAARLSIRDRGLLREGLAADVVIFDPETIADRATFEKPHQASVGVKHVFVNGTAVVREGRHAGAKPGQIVRGPGYIRQNATAAAATSKSDSRGVQSLVAPTAAAMADAPLIAPEIDLVWGVKIPMRDGITLNATVYKPKRLRDRAPVICTMTPYISDTYHDRAMYFARKGFVFALVDVRGRGNSAGRFEPFAQEPRDGHDVVEWLAKQPWCVGKVALWGGSYAGFNQWATLKEFPPHLTTIVPAAAAHPGVDFPAPGNIFFPYDIQWLTYTSGVTPNVKLFGESSYWISKFREYYFGHIPFRQLDTLVGNSSQHFQNWLKHRTPDDYWDAMVPAPGDYARMDLPILTITGHYDGDQPGAMTYYRRHMEYGSVKGCDRHYLLIGPWDHAGTRTPAEEIGGLRFGKVSLVDLNDLHREWYEWTMRDGPKPKFLQKRVGYFVAGAEEWKFADRLEAIPTQPTRLYLTSPEGAPVDAFRSGTLSRVKPDQGRPARYNYDPLEVRPAELEREPSKNGLTDQRSALNLFGNGLVYHSEPFADATEITGYLKLIAWIALDVPDTDFTVSVFEIKPDGTSIALTDDIKRARYRQSLRNEQLVTPGSIERYEFASFRFFSRRLEKGSRLRLVFWSPNSIYLEKNYNSGGEVADESRKDARTAHVTLYQDAEHPSYLEIPVVGASGSK